MSSTLIHLLQHGEHGRTEHATCDLYECPEQELSAHSSRYSSRAAPCHWKFVPIEIFVGRFSAGGAGGGGRRPGWAAGNSVGAGVRQSGHDYRERARSSSKGSKNATHESWLPGFPLGMIPYYVRERNNTLFIMLCEDS